MTDVWLGVIAVSVALTAMMQIVVLMMLAKLAKAGIAAVKDVRKDLSPLIAKVNKVADDAGKVSALALRQVERVDAVVDRTTVRIDDTLHTVQSAIISPVRQGAAVIAGLKAALGVFRARQDRRHYGRDEEDPLFIG